MANEPLVDQPTSAPTRKVTAGLAAGGVVTLIVALLAQFGVVIPEDVSLAVVAVIGGVVTIAQFVAAYFTRNRANEV